MKFSVFILLFTTIITNGFCGETRAHVDSVRDGYKETLNRAIAMCKENTRPDSRVILACIPITQKEAMMLFDIDYKKETQGCFAELLDAMVFYCENKDASVMKAFMHMSQFVDGYFAEDYFDKMGVLYSRHRSFYCDVFRAADPAKTKRLVGYELDCMKR